MHGVIWPSYTLPTPAHVSSAWLWPPRSSSWYTLSRSDVGSQQSLVKLLTVVEQYGRFSTFASANACRASGERVGAVAALDDVPGAVGEVGCSELGLSLAVRRHPAVVPGASHRRSDSGAYPPDEKTRSGAASRRGRRTVMPGVEVAGMLPRCRPKGALGC